MAESPASPNQPSSFKAQYVPFEDRESNKTSWKPFAWDMLRFLVVAKLSGIVGYQLGKNLEKQKIGIGRLKIDRGSGGFILGTAGGFSELFRHWKKVEKKRLGVANISSDLKTAMDPTQLETEAKKEEVFLADLQTLQEKMASPKSYSEAVTARREAVESQEHVRS